MTRILLLRYDTEGPANGDMDGFLEKAVAVHRAEGIPATFFCTGKALDQREAEFRRFWAEVKDDPLFDLQDHSYTHIGVGYEAGQPVETLRADYERSFAAHERIFGKRPVGVSICGTSGRDGARLSGFDVTDKARQELDMLAAMGLRMINTFLAGADEATEFCHFGRVGHPEIMGFPSAYSDTSWMARAASAEEAVAFILDTMASHAAREAHMPVLLHDWCAWTRAGDKELTHVKRIAAQARKLAYDMRTHAACLDDKALWKQR